MLFQMELIIMLKTSIMNQNFETSTSIFPFVTEGAFDGKFSPQKALADQILKPF